MEKRPVIGLNMSLEAVKDEDRWEIQVPLFYVDAVMAAGGLPVCVPPCEDLSVIAQWMSFIDGFIFTGGDDYHPRHYGGHPQPAAELMPERRDRFDVSLAKWILDKTDLPVLGICGGQQLIAIARGGSLVQDIKMDWPTPDSRVPIPHAKRERPEDDHKTFRHVVIMTPGSLITRILTDGMTDRIDTNSFHHQAVHPLHPGNGLTVSAWTEDGIVEAIEPAEGSAWARAGRFVLGVQWHPERMQDEEPERHLFQALVKAAKRHKEPA
ncbi:MAG: putative glutamine amidotransferase [Syntrophus sp. SKADARSKE-3]|nr:putative glutamine amidotransferase [Syntrophus sp. SKADARSKE-3]